MGGEEERACTLQSSHTYICLLNSEEEAETLSGVACSTQQELQSSIMAVLLLSWAGRLGRVVPAIQIRTTGSSTRKLEIDTGQQGFAQAATAKACLTETER